MTMDYPPALGATVERCYATIDNDPRILLETAGGPVGLTANVIVARLYGWDGQVDHELRLRRVEPELLMPIHERPAMASSPAIDDYRPPRFAEYTLQSNYASGFVSAELAPKEPHGDDFRVSVLCVRYKLSR